MATEALQASPTQTRQWALIAFVLMTLIWGSTWFAIRMQLNGTDPYVSVSLRFALAAVVMALWILASGGSFRLDRRIWALIPVQGATIYGINYLFAYSSSQYIVSGLVALVFALNVMVSLLLEPIVLGRRSPPVVWWSVLLGLIGLALVLAPDLQGKGSGDLMLGVGLAFGGAATVGLGGVLSARLMDKGAPVTTLNFYGFISGALIAASAALISGEHWQVHWTPAYLASLAYLALIGSVAAFALYLTAVRTLGAVRAGYSSILTPIIALLISGLLEGLQPRWTLLAGMALILAGNGLILGSRGRRSAR